MRRAVTAWGVALVLFAALAPNPSAAADPSFDAATGYRIAHYRAPTPETVPGGQRVSLEDVQRLVAQGAVLVDVMPSDGAGPDAATGVWHVPKPRFNMAGSIWLPDVGRGVLTPAMDAYFKSNLARSTDGRQHWPIVVYCQADCWMSWNALKRAASYGYTSLYWYAEGTDGMSDWDVALVPATPVPAVP
jgi:PQQ-dependent catabolism-associated CXXCW motif protein